MSVRTSEPLDEDAERESRTATVPPADRRVSAPQEQVSECR